MSATATMPACLPGFEKIRRYWDARWKHWVAQINPGEFYVTKSQELISTVLGSCISALIWDERFHFGGMNHFMLPDAENEVSDAWRKLDAKNANTRYGNYAMERLVNELVKLGARRQDLRVKLVGGGMMWKGNNTVGERNAEFAEQYVQREGLRLLGTDFGEHVARRVIFNPQDGSAKVKKLASSSVGTVRDREQTYIQEIAKPAAGDIELF